MSKHGPRKDAMDLEILSREIRRRSLEKQDVRSEGPVSLAKEGSLERVAIVGNVDDMDSMKLETDPMEGSKKDSKSVDRTKRKRSIRSNFEEGKDERSVGPSPIDGIEDGCLIALQKIGKTCMKSGLLRPKKFAKLKSSEKDVYVDLCGRYSARLVWAMAESLRRLRALMGKRIVDPDPLENFMSGGIDLFDEIQDKEGSTSSSYERMRLWAQIQALNSELVGRTRQLIQQGGHMSHEEVTESGKEKQGTERKSKTFKDIYFAMFADGFEDDLDEMRKQEERTNKRGSINVELIKQAIETGTDIFTPWQQEILVAQHAEDQQHQKTSP